MVESLFVGNLIAHVVASQQQVSQSIQAGQTFQYGCNKNELSCSQSIGYSLGPRRAVETSIISAVPSPSFRGFCEICFFKESPPAWLTLPKV